MIARSREPRLRPHGPTTKAFVALLRVGAWNVWVGGCTNTRYTTSPGHPLALFWVHGVGLHAWVGAWFCVWRYTPSSTCPTVRALGHLNAWCAGPSSARS